MPARFAKWKRFFSAALPGVTIKSMADLDTAARAQYSAEETGTTYAENALIKARALSQLVDGVVIADDSGFEVESLGGEPGVYSARYAENDGARCAKIISSLSGNPVEQRRVKFIACIAILTNGKIRYLFSAENMVLWPKRRGGKAVLATTRFFAPKQVAKPGARCRQKKKMPTAIAGARLTL